MARKRLGTQNCHYQAQKGQWTEKEKGVKIEGIGVVKAIKVKKKEGRRTERTEEESEGVPVEEAEGGSKEEGVERGKEKEGEGGVWEEEERVVVDEDVDIISEAITIGGVEEEKRDLGGRVKTEKEIVQTKIWRRFKKEIGNAVII